MLEYLKLARYSELNELKRQKKYLCNTIAFITEMYVRGKSVQDILDSMEWKVKEVEKQEKDVFRHFT